jgi:TPR repeat protein
MEFLGQLVLSSIIMRIMRIILLLTICLTATACSNQNETRYEFSPGDNSEAERQALEVMRGRAESGNEDAKIDMIILDDIRNGKIDTAVVGLENLATKGNARAAILLGSMYMYGKHVDYDSSKAMYWYKEASSLGDLEARRIVSSMHESN